MPLSRSKGFSLVELLISIAILGVLATASLVSLRSSQDQEQLYTAARVLANDLRSMQSQALSSGNVKICDMGAGGFGVCEADATGCVVGTCLPRPPVGVGVHLHKGTAAYDMYAKADFAGGDTRFTNARELINRRDFSQAGAPDIEVKDISTTPAAASQDDMHVIFLRQNGTMQINQCGATCVAATDMVITLWHKTTQNTVTVSLNTLTGRITSQP